MNKVKKVKKFKFQQITFRSLGMFFIVFLISGIDTSCINAQDGVAQKSAGLKLKTHINPTDSAEMVFVPAGEFIMGSDSAEIDHIWKKMKWEEYEKEFTKGEQPTHQVRVDGFWMYRTLVTVAQYRRFCIASSRRMPDAPSYGWKDDNPIVNVNWQDAKDYCIWAGGRLPYEAEWEYAARGGHTGIGSNTRTIFVWGDEMPVTIVANLADMTFLKSGYYSNPNFHIFAKYTDGYATASPVKSFPPNDFRLYDMAGNVLEWCEDWFEKDYYRHSPIDNPHGPDRGTNRVLRGGAFDTTPTITRISRRLSNDPGIRNNEKGFRCVKENEQR